MYAHPIHVFAKKLLDAISIVIVCATFFVATVLIMPQNARAESGCTTVMCAQTFCTTNYPTYNQVIGTAAGNTLNGTNGVNNCIIGLGGNDTITGGDIDDYIEGNVGTDIINGGAGSDFIVGGRQNDTIRGNDGDDVIYGDVDTGTILSYGSDTLYGDDGYDQIWGDDGDAGSDELNQGLADTIYGDDGTGTMNDGGNDLYGGGGADNINGSADTDVIEGGSGSDTINGNGGDDFIWGDAITGTATTYGADSIDGGSGNDSIYGDDGDAGDENVGVADTALNGGAGDDWVWAGGGDDTVDGGANDDTINGNDGADTLRGGDGIDTITGNAGDDFIYGDNGNDASLAGNGGNDTIYGGAGVDAIYGDETNGTGSGTDVLYGEAGSDAMNGCGGNDSLDGGAGDTDTIDGAAGDDFCVGAAGDPASDPAGTFANCERCNLGMATCSTGNIALIKHVAAYRSGGAVAVQWSTASEVGTVSFNLYRVEGGSKTLVTSTALMALPFAAQGSHYLAWDRVAQSARGAIYEIVETDFHGKTNSYGPFSLVFEESNAALALMQGQNTVTARTSTPLIAKGFAADATLSPSRVHPPMSGASVVKVGITRTGWQRVPLSSIAAKMGVSTGEVKQWVAAGELSVRRGTQTLTWRASKNAEGIDFYGTANDSAYSHEAVCWISHAKGSQALSYDNEPGVGSATAFADYAHIESDDFAATAFRPNPDSDYWFMIGKDEVGGNRFGLSAATPSMAFTFTADGVVDASSATLRVNVQGATSGPDADAHRINVLLNGQALGLIAFENRRMYGGTFAVPAGVLKAGLNTLVLSYNSSSAINAVEYVDSIDLWYTRKLVAVNNSLTFTATSSAQATVTGFSGNDVSVVDVSDPSNVFVVGNATIESGASGSQARFHAEKGHSYVVTTDGAVPTVASTWADKPSTLRDAQNAADFVIITRSDFMEDAQTFADYRQKRGLTPMVVDIEDIYDEFNGGDQSPRAIQSFIKYALATWAVKPRYVLLAGAGHYDFNGRNVATGNVLPPLMVSTSQGAFASDVAVADVTGDDGVPEVIVGRIPAEDAATLHSVIQKIMAYEKSGGEWTKSITLAADNKDGDTSFSQASDELGTMIGGGFTVNRVYVEELGVEAGKAKFIQALQQGGFMINYLGHGGLDVLGKQPFFETDDLAQMTSEQGWPIISAMTCLVARFAVPGYKALGEEMVIKPDGGMIAAVGSEGISTHQYAERLGKHFYEATLSGEHARLGDALQQARVAYASEQADRDTLFMYQLLGDPTLELKTYTGTIPGVNDEGSMGHGGGSSGGCAVKTPVDRNGSMIMAWALAALAVIVIRRRRKVQ